MAAEPADQDLNLYQGAYWSEQILWKDADNVVMNLAGYTARMQIRRKVTSTVTLISLTTENGRITLGTVEDPPGTPVYNILLEIDAADTEDLPATPTDRRWYYDLELIPAGGEVRRLMMGRIVVSPEVTR